LRANKTSKKRGLMGVVTDGRRMIFGRFMSDRWQVEQPVPVDATSVTWLLRLLVHLQSGIALIPSNLIEDFGSDTITAQRTTRALYSALETSNDALVKALFGQWQTVFGEVTGHGEGASRLRENAEFKRFGRGMGLQVGQVEPPEAKRTALESTVKVQVGGKEPIGESESSRKVLSRCYSRVEIDRQRAHKHVTLIVEEVIQRLTSQLGCPVEITLEISARRPEGCDKSAVRTISENSRTLKFEGDGFEEGQNPR
jgi:hypothetical protein